MEGESPQLGDLLTIVINHLLNGMILQVGTLPKDLCFLNGKSTFPLASKMCAKSGFFSKALNLPVTTWSGSGRGKIIYLNGWWNIIPFGQMVDVGG